MWEYFGPGRFDKFKTFRLTMAAASKVKAPLINECYANLECRIVDAGMAAKYNFFILEIIKAWIERRVHGGRQDDQAAF
jgi:flavin reductase (DIM6/NTAB) family NADH-FMN oxidoreductase RutF